MGFFAGELEQLLRARTNAHSSPWAMLTHTHLRPQRIERLKKAAQDISHTTILPSEVRQQLRCDLELSFTEWARLQAAYEADTFLRLLMFHNFPLDEAVNKANAVFASALKDTLARGELSHVQLSDGPHPEPPPSPRARHRPPRE